jgi:hypothetical protein
VKFVTQQELDLIELQLEILALQAELHQLSFSCSILISLAETMRKLEWLEKSEKVYDGLSVVREESE